MTRHFVRSDRLTDELRLIGRQRTRYPDIQTIHNDNRTPASQDLVFAGLHPPALPGCLAEIKVCLKPNTILISLAPKLSIAKLAGLLDGFD